MNEMQVFNNPEFGKIRSMLRNNEPWFVGKDVAEALGYARPTDTARRNVEDDDRGIAEIATPSGIQDMTVINESGLYSLIFSSKLPKAKEFKHWVTSEVLPSIRKVGTYSISAPLPNVMALSGIASLVNTNRRIMKDQGSTPTAIAAMAYRLETAFGIPLLQNFVREMPEQLSLFANRQIEISGDGVKKIL